MMNKAKRLEARTRTSAKNVWLIFTVSSFFALIIYITKETPLHVTALHNGVTELRIESFNRTRTRILINI